MKWDIFDGIPVKKGGGATQVRQKGRSGGTKEPGHRVVWGADRRPKTVFFLRRRLLPQALTQVVTALAPPSRKRWWWNKKIKMYSTSGPVAQCRKEHV